MRLAARSGQKRRLRVSFVFQRDQWEVELGTEAEEATGAWRYQGFTVTSLPFHVAGRSPKALYIWILREDFRFFLSRLWTTSMVGWVN